MKRRRAIGAKKLHPGSPRKESGESELRRSEQGLHRRGNTHSRGIHRQRRRKGHLHKSPRMIQRSKRRKGGEATGIRRDPSSNTESSGSLRRYATASETLPPSVNLKRSPPPQTGAGRVALEPPKSKISGEKTTRSAAAPAPRSAQVYLRRLRLPGKMTGTRRLSSAHRARSPRGGGRRRAGGGGRTPAAGAAGPARGRAHLAPDTS